MSPGCAVQASVAGHCLGPQRQAQRQSTAAHDRPPGRDRNLCSADNSGPYREQQRLRTHLWPIATMIALLITPRTLKPTFSMAQRPHTGFFECFPFVSYYRSGHRQRARSRALPPPLRFGRRGSQPWFATVAVRVAGRARCLVFRNECIQLSQRWRPPWPRRKIVCSAPPPIV